MPSCPFMLVAPYCILHVRGGALSSGGDFVPSCPFASFVSLMPFVPFLSFTTFYAFRAFLHTPHPTSHLLKLSLRDLGTDKQVGVEKNRFYAQFFSLFLYLSCLHFYNTTRKCSPWHKASVTSFCSKGIL